MASELSTTRPLPALCTSASGQQRLTDEVHARLSLLINAPITVTLVRPGVLDTLIHFTIRHSPHSFFLACEINRVTPEGIDCLMTEKELVQHEASTFLFTQNAF